MTMLKAKNFFQYYIERVLRKIRLLGGKSKTKPVFIPNQRSGIKLHLGSGPINIQGWINVDARDDAHVHIVKDNLWLSDFSSDSISEIYMCHVLEHFSFDESLELLKVYHDKLIHGGLLRISVPDFDKLINIYKENNDCLDVVRKPLMGGQDYPHNFHKSVYNEQYLREILEKCGFGRCVVWNCIDDFGVDLGDWSSRLLHTKNGKFPVSLNLKANAVKSLRHVEKEK